MAFNTQTGALSGPIPLDSHVQFEIQSYYNNELINTQNVALTHIYESLPALGADEVPTNQPVILSLSDGVSDAAKTQLCENLALYAAATELSASCTATFNKIILKPTNDYDVNTNYTIKHMNVDIINFKTSNSDVPQRGKVLSIYNPLDDGNTTHYTYSREVFMNLRALFKLYNERQDDPLYALAFRDFADTLDLLVNSELGDILLDDNVSGDIRYSVNFSKIEYTSIDLSGNLVTQSGLIAYSDAANQSMPLISNQHSTISTNVDAPSNSLHTCNVLFPTIATVPFTNTEYVSGYNLDCDFITNSSDSHKLTIFLLAVLAYKGAFVVAPDYLGFGNTSNLTHPYLHAEATGASVIDAMRAAKDAVARQISLNVGANFSLSTDNFVGYSQGGSATVVARKIAEERYSDEFGIASSAAVAGGGPYALDESLTTFYLTENANLPAATRILLDYALPLLNDLYNVPISNTDIFTYLSNEDTPIAFNPSFISSYQEQTDRRFQLMKKYLLLNDVYKWQPQSGRIRLVHGSIDLIAPVLNANTAHARMNTSGNDVTKHTDCILENGHIACVPDYLRVLVPEIQFNQ